MPEGCELCRSEKHHVWVAAQRQVRLEDQTTKSCCQINQSCASWPKVVSGSSERGQRTLPFASYGGQRMNVAYATQGMDHDRKLMSMRGNNIHFTRIVTPHELIPGHHLQSYMTARHNTHRRSFRTPFSVEGWALYWEMLLWDMGYARGPEDRIGMLF